MNNLPLRIKYTETSDFWAKPYVYGDGVRHNKFKQPSSYEMMSSAKLKRVHKTIIDAFILANSIDLNHFSKFRQGQIIYIKNSLGRLCDEVGAIKKKRGIR